MALLSVVACMSTVIKTKKNPLPQNPPRNNNKKNKQQNQSRPIETMKNPAHFLTFQGT